MYITSDDILKNINWYFISTCLAYVWLIQYFPDVDINCFVTEHPANVAYQEFDVPADFPFHLKQFLPNVFYSPHTDDHISQRYWGIDWLMG